MIKVECGETTHTAHATHVRYPLNLHQSYEGVVVLSGLGGVMWAHTQNPVVYEDVLQLQALDPSAIRDAYNAAERNSFLRSDMNRQTTTRV